jgi:4-hydroxy-4-methyl-2-oxoglutarate aldolase
MSYQVVRNIARPDPATLQSLSEQGVATVHEAQGRTGLMRTHMRPIYPGARICGAAVTVSLPPGDNLMIHAAVEVCHAGDVLIVVPTSDCTDGYFGDLLATSLRSRGVVGLIIEAGVRDVADLTAMRFPVWSRAVNAQGTVKASPGSVNVPVVCASVLVNPGDAVIADDDGVVVVPRARVTEVLALAQERTAKEAAARERLGAGEFGMDIYGLREKLAAMGVQYVEGPDDSHQR